MSQSSTVGSDGKPVIETPQAREKSTAFKRRLKVDATAKGCSQSRGSFFTVLVLRFTISVCPYCLGLITGSYQHLLDVGLMKERKPQRKQTTYTQHSQENQNTINGTTTMVLSLTSTGFNRLTFPQYRTSGYAGYPHLTRAGLLIKHHSSHPTKSTDNKIPQNCMDSEGDTDLLILQLSQTPTYAARPWIRSQYILFLLELLYGKPVLNRFYQSSYRLHRKSSFNSPTIDININCTYTHIFTTPFPFINTYVIDCVTVQCR